MIWFLIIINKLKDKEKDGEHQLLEEHDEEAVAAPYGKQGDAAVRDRRLCAAVADDPQQERPSGQRRSGNGAAAVQGKDGRAHLGDGRRRHRPPGGAELAPTDGRADRPHHGRHLRRR